MEKFFDVKHLTDQKFLLENFLFSVGPITALIAARFGRRAWIKYEIVVSIILGIVLAFKSDLILSFVVSYLLFFYVKNNL